jgi:hypothetical protein
MAKKAIHELPVSWRNVSFGDKDVSIGFSMSRGKHSPMAIDKILTGKRLSCRLFAGPGTDGDGQPSLIEDSDLELEAVFDSSGFGVKPKRYTGTLSTTIANVDSATIAKFAKRDGRVEVTSIETPEGDDDSGDE